ncbi:Glutaredoxin [Fasciola hepatica]|uniref:Glutaredoxin n=1 Tax=Fasciola hepatica TaxID=6192 RepID=A0A4E0REZ4_FASHE|nr:Glutaredoxin [Fasciola hepatica]
MDLNLASLNALKNELSTSKTSLVLNVIDPQVVQCAQVSDVLKILAEDPKNKNILFRDVDARNFETLTRELKVNTVPTVILFHHGVEINRVCGANAAEITKAVMALQARHSAPGTGDHSGPSSLETRLRQLINRAPIMLFMKGQPDAPQCGFSRQIIDILRSANARFDSFDILQDEEVRQGLKSLSNWPTYPQLYVKGELIGGLDIVKELAESGELAEIIKT